MTVLPENKNVFRSFLPVTRIYSTCSRILRQLQRIVDNDPYFPPLLPLPAIIWRTGQYRELKHEAVRAVRRDIEAQVRGVCETVEPPVVN